METTITLGGVDLDCTFTVSGGKFKGNYITPADPIEVEVECISYNGIPVTDLIEACGMTQRVETLIHESL
jgi:hypothetical protein